MYTHSLIIFLFTSVIPLCHYGQDIKYARSVVDTLAAPGMHGRGYVNDGDKIAAAYIENEFKKLGVKAFSKSYRQEFTLPVNTFPSEVKIAVIPGVAIPPGEDYIIDAASPSIDAGNIKTFHIDSASQQRLLNPGKYRKKYKDRVVVINPAGMPKEVASLIEKNKWSYSGARAVIIVRDKLTWSVSQEVGKYVVIEISTAGGVAQALKLFGSVIDSIKVDNKFIPSYKTQNVIGYIPGTQYPDSFIVFSAHYDHLGRMGRHAYFPGANDNASGIAMMLNLAKYYSENKPKYSIAFMAFGAEEAGLVGSRYYVEHPLFPLKRIKFLINTDLAGTGDDGITVVNGTVFNTEYKQMVKLNAQGSYLKEVKARGKAANSDHYFFTEAGVPAFFIYTLGGIKAYHDVYDRAETLPLTEFEDYFRLLNDFIKYLANEY